MAVYLHAVEDPQQVKDAITAEVKFTHSHPVVIDAIWIYQLAIGRLVKGDTPTQAFDFCLSVCAAGVQ